jgi:RNA polymerase sigma-70 factor (ECF subfamily)
MADATDRRDARPGLRLYVRDASAPADELLVRAFLAGDDDAFGEIVRRHQRAVLAVVRRYAQDADDARDLAQRAFLKAFQAARRSRWLGAKGAVPFRAWLFRIAVNLGRNQLRDALRWRRAPAAAAERLPVAPVGTDALERAERERAVRAAVLGLPRRQREVLTLRIDAELSFRDIAEALGITELNARVHFHHAARRLREVVAGEERP